MQALAISLFPVLNVLGVVLMFFAFTLLVPLAIAFFGSEPALAAYDKSFLTTIGAGAAMWFVTRRFKRELQPRDGFLLVTLVWTVLPAFSTLPLTFFMPELSFTDAYFEAMSGLSTTGATVLTGLDALPASINFWRCQLQWIGGMLPFMGIQVIAIFLLYAFPAIGLWLPNVLYGR